MMTSWGSTTFLALPKSRPLTGAFRAITMPSRASEVSSTKQGPWSD